MRVYLIIALQGKMIAAIKRWLAERKRRGKAIAIAQNAFRRAHPEQKLVPWRIPPVAVDDGVYVVTVCFQMSRPPLRSWWRVRIGAESAEELTREEASKLIRTPIWR